MIFSLQVIFLIIFPSITWNSNNSNLFWFPLKVQVIESQLYNQVSLLSEQWYTHLTGFTQDQYNADWYDLKWYELIYVRLDMKA